MIKNFNIIDHIIADKGINKAKIAKHLGVKPPFITKLSQGKPFGSEVANKISEKYGYSLDFILTGKENINQKGNIEPENLEPIPFDSYMMVEYEDLATSAGYLGINNLHVLPDTKKRLVPKEFERGKYLVVRVDGHSMEDGSSMSIPDGTEILIRQINLDPNTKLPIRNNLFVVVSKDGVVLKQIIEHNIEEGYIRCHSYNPNFRDYIIPLTDVLQIFLYRKIVSFRPPIPDIKY